MLSATNIISKPKIYSVVFMHNLFGDYESRFVFALNDREAFSILNRTMDMSLYEVVTWSVIDFESIVEHLESLSKLAQNPFNKLPVIVNNKEPEDTIKEKEKPEDIKLKSQLMKDIINNKDKKLLASIKHIFTKNEYKYIQSKIKKDNN